MNRKNNEDSVGEEEQRKKRKQLELENSVQSQLTSEDQTSNVIICIEENEDSVFGTYPGRRSFGGFNSVVERNYSNSLDSSKLDAKLQLKTDEEILAKIDKLSSLPRGPNQVRNSLVNIHVQL